MNSPYDKAPSWLFVIVVAFTAFVLTVLVASGQDADDGITIGECLRSSGYSTHFAPNIIEDMVGVDVWGDEGIYALRNFERRRAYYLLERGSETEFRYLWFMWLGDSVYVFVFKHPDDPTRRLAHEPANAWHGDCMLRLNNYVSPRGLYATR